MQEFVLDSLAQEFLFNGLSHSASAFYSVLKAYHPTYEWVIMGAHGLP